MVFVRITLNYFNSFINILKGMGTIMNVLIFSISAGGGHMHAASSLKSYIKLDDPKSKVEIIDTFNYINPILDKLIIGTYLRSLKISPASFGFLYRHTENTELLYSISSRLVNFISPRLLSLIYDFNPDVIISTHPFSNDMLSSLKVSGKISCPIISILTDYSPHKFWIHPHIDGYVVSSKEMKIEMIKRKVPASLVYDFGIPVSPKFLISYPKAETLKSIGLSPNKTTILIMGGSLGIGNILKVYDELLLINFDFQIIVITGNNEKLKSALTERSEFASKKTFIIGYTDEVNKYMRCSDLLISKPGGLTVSEALICHTPLFLISPIPGQEEKNAEFLLKHKLAFQVNDDMSCSKKISYILMNPELLSSMKDRYANFAKPHSGNNIIDLMKNCLESNKGVL